MRLTGHKAGQHKRAWSLLDVEGIIEGWEALEGCSWGMAGLGCAPRLWQESGGTHEPLPPDLLSPSLHYLHG